MSLIYLPVEKSGLLQRDLLHKMRIDPTTEAST